MLIDILIARVSCITRNLVSLIATTEFVFGLPTNDSSYDCCYYIYRFADCYCIEVCTLLTMTVVLTFN